MSDASVCRGESLCDLGLGAAFLGCTLVALFVHGTPRIYVPSVVLLSLGLLTRRLGLWYARARGLVQTTSV